MVFPFLASLRTLLEHRAEDADPRANYAEVDQGPVNRLFGSGPLASTLGSAGFNRHALHHWEPQISYTRLKDIEAYLLRTEVGPARPRPPDELQRDLPTPARALNSPHRDPTCHVCGAALDELWATATDTEYGTTSRRYSYLPLPRLRLPSRSTRCRPINSNVIYPPTYYSFASGGEAGGAGES